MRSHKVNEKGMTLVEILAALVILGIVFVGFMTVFPQMTNFNEKTESKLETMNLAKKELAEIKRNPSHLFRQNKNENNNGQNIEQYVYASNGGKYIFEIDYFVNPDLDGQSREDALSLHKIHIKVKKGDKIISETYGYIKHNRD